MPAEARPRLNDRRRLGVCSALDLRTRSDLWSIALDEEAGWREVEEDSAHLLCWTDGLATLAVPVEAAILEVTVARTLPYALQAERRAAN